MWYDTDNKARLDDSNFKATNITISEHYWFMLWNNFTHVLTALLSKHPSDTPMGCLYCFNQNNSRVVSRDENNAKSD
jgi:hypothetical protein